MFLFLNPKKRQEFEHFFEEAAPVLIMGRGHSGTRIVSFICSNLGINLGHEEQATGDVVNRRFTKVIKKISLKNLGITTTYEVQDSDLKLFKKAVYRYFKELKSDSTKHWGWKFPETYLVAPVILKAFPKVKFIHLVRDGRDVAFKRHLTDDPRKIFGRKILNYLNCLDKQHIEQAALSWEFQVNNFNKFKNRLENKNSILDVKFEEICKTPVEEAKRISDFLKMPFTNECLSFCENQINASKISQYKENSPADISIVEASIANTLRELGYI